MPGAKRDNKQKPDLSYLTPDFEEPVARVMMFGAEKYGKWNFLKGHAITSIIASIKRHCGKILAGNDIDSESMEKHFAHIAANCLIAMRQETAGTLFDDRVTGKVTDGHIKGDASGTRKTRRRARRTGKGKGRNLSNRKRGSGSRK